MACAEHADDPQPSWCAGLPPRIVAKIAHDPDGCWLWTGATKDNGYPVVWWGGTMALAHRVVYELLVGPIPEGMHVDHVRASGCRHRHCVRPDHLEPVTQAENNRRAMRESCVHGHPFTPENTYVRRDGRGRQCRRCKADRAKS